jgi:hypothetical protein
MKRIFRTLALVVGVALATPLLAASEFPVVTYPQGRASKNVSSTIQSASNAFQQVIPAVTGGVAEQRASCTIQNNGTHTMYVFAGPIASATLTNSVQLPAGQFFYCYAGVTVISDQISITGTAGDAFYAAYQ